jgi:hypothetical protein
MEIRSTIQRSTSASRVVVDARLRRARLVGLVGMTAHAGQ